jgi:hypothetical protein
MEIRRFPSYLTRQFAGSRQLARILVKRRISVTESSFVLVENLFGRAKPVLDLILAVPCRSRVLSIVWMCHLSMKGKSDEVVTSRGLRNGSQKRHPKR